jgi:hypothetical protein
MNNKTTIYKLKLIENLLRKIENGITKINYKINSKKEVKTALKDIEENLFSARWGILNTINKLNKKRKT